MEAGVAAHAVNDSAECLADPQLRPRPLPVELDHPERRLPGRGHPLPPVPHAGRAPRRRAPFLGEHTFDVLADLLGYDPDRIADLAAAEALE